MMRRRHQRSRRPGQTHPRSHRRHPVPRPRRQTPRSGLGNETGRRSYGPFSM